MYAKYERIHKDWELFENIIYESIHKKKKT